MATDKIRHKKTRANDSTGSSLPARRLTVQGGQVKSESDSRASRIVTAFSPSSRGPGRRPDPLLRQRIIKSACQLFGSREFHRVRAQELADLAGVGKGTLYRCFRSKRELYLAAIVEGFAELKHNLEKALASTKSPIEQIKTIVYETVAYFWDRKLFFVILQTTDSASDSLYGRFYAERAKLSEMLRNAINDGIKAGELRSDLDCRLCAEALLGMIRGLIRFQQQGDTPESAAETILAVFFNGMFSGRCRKASTSRALP